MGSSEQSTTFTHRALELMPGISGGVARCVVGQPFDTIKTRLQVMGQGTAMAAHLPPHMVYSSSYDCLRKMVAHEGTLSLYKGITSPLVGNMAMLGIHFPVFTKVMDSLGDESESRLNVWKTLISGGVAGLAGSTVSTPVELIRTKLQLQAKSSAKSAGEAVADASSQAYKGSVDCVRQLVSQHGLRGIYRGFATTMLRDIQGYAFFFLGYEATIHLILDQYEGKRTRSDLSCWEVASAGSIAGVGLWGSMYPIDTVKTKLQADNLLRPAYNSMADCYSKTVAREGHSGLWRGFSAALYRALPVNAAVFLAVDVVRSFVTRLRPVEFPEANHDGHGSQVEGTLGYFSQNADTP